MSYNYNQTTRDVLHFIDTESIENRNTKNSCAWEQFIEELDIQEQINETELDSGIPTDPTDI